MPITAEEVKEGEEIRKQFGDALQEIAKDNQSKSFLNLAIYSLFGLVAVLLAIVIVVLVKRRMSYKNRLERFKSQMKRK